MSESEPNRQVVATEEQQKAIASLKRLARKWPSSLWLFSGSGTLCVMAKSENGERVFSGQTPDQRYVLDTVMIENDGGDW